MLVICNGMPRSASTWSFNVVTALLRCSKPLCEVHCGYDENIEQFLKSIPSTATHAVVKCHELDAYGCALTRSGVVKVIYTWRDPADAVVSCMRMFDYSFARSLATVDSSLELYRLHRQLSSTLIINYKQIVFAAVESVQRIATFLELDYDAHTIKAVAEQTSLERLREKAESLTDASLVHPSGSDYDPETLLHPGHIRDGGIGYGRRSLSAEQAEKIDALLRKHSLAQMIWTSQT
jgi:hypothetical protein